MRGLIERRLTVKSSNQPIGLKHQQNQWVEVVATGDSQNVEVALM